MNVKIKIRIGEAEIKYEGSAQVLSDRLRGWLKDLSTVPAATSGLPNRSSPPEANVTSVTEEEPSTSEASPSVGTIDNVAAKMGCKTGPDLIMVAAAFLTFGVGTPRFDRQLLKDEMKKSKYYKSSYLNNLGSYLHRLVKRQQLFEITTGVYQLAPKVETELRAKLVS